MLRDAWIVAGYGKAYNNWFLLESDQASPGIRLKSSCHFAYYCGALIDNVQSEITGQLKVFAPTFKAIIDGLGDSGADEVTIWRDGGGVVQVISGKAKFGIGCADPSSFPKIKEVASYHEVKLDASNFKSIVKRVAYIQSDQVPGVELRFGDGRLRMCATDGVRLAMDSMEIDSDIEDKLYISHASLDILAKSANSMDGTILFGWNEDDIVMDYDTTTVEVRRNTMKFPPADSLLEMFAANPLKSLVDSTELNAVLKTMGLFHDEKKDNLCPLIMQFEKGKLTLRITNKEAGKGSGEWSMPCKFNGKGKFTIKFNLRLLKEFMSGILGSEMILRMKNDETPVLIELVEVDRYKRKSCGTLKMMLTPMKWT